MNILIIGNGGREHALAWKAAQSPLASKIFVAPGNAGTALETNVENIAIDVLDIDGLIAFAKQESIGLTIVGPEAPLAAGIVDAFQAADLKCFGPSQKAAQLEASKAFSKQFMERYAIPTGSFAAFTELSAAQDYIKEQGAPLVIKADGLAAGKGVVVAQDEAEALKAAADMLGENRFGDAGHRIVVEEFLEGEEASFIVMVDGKNIVPMASSQDHKARDDGDTGPNTGGMGAYSPAPIVTAERYDDVMQNVIIPTVEGMIHDGTPYTGFLYAGLMFTKFGPKVLEFNCRFGDPETQVIMLRLQSDLVALCDAACQQQLEHMTTEWDQRVALGVVMAAAGYPESYPKGDVIEGLQHANEQADSKVFHAGTKQQNDTIVTHGGRVLCATALGKNTEQAQQNAYQLVDKIHWDGAYYRKDIGHRAINKK